MWVLNKNLLFNATFIYKSEKYCHLLFFFNLAKVNRMVIIVSVELRTHILSQVSQSIL